MSIHPDAPGTRHVAHSIFRFESARSVVFLQERHGPSACPARLVVPARIAFALHHIQIATVPLPAPLHPGAHAQVSLHRMRVLFPREWTIALQVMNDDVLRELRERG